MPCTPAPHVPPEVARYLLAMIQATQAEYPDDGTAGNFHALSDVVGTLRYFANGFTPEVAS